MNFVFRRRRILMCHSVHNFGRINWESSHCDTVHSDWIDVL